MKKHLIKALSLFLVCACFIGLCAPTAFAATTTSSKSFTGSSRGGTSHYIYVKTNDTTKSKSVKLTFNKGKLKTTSSTDLLGSTAKTFEIRAAYEIKIYYWNGKSWVKEDSYDAYNWSSDTIPLKKANTVYRIQVYQWRASTTLTSYKNKGKVSYSTSSTYVSDPYWSKIPTFKVGSASCAKIYTSNPL